MNKKSVGLFGLIALSALIMVVLGYYHGQQAGKIDDEMLRIKTTQRSYEVSLTDIMTFDIVIFEATVRSSGNDPEVIEFGGVLLFDILVDLDIDLSGEETVIFKSLDGYQTRVSAQEVMQTDNVYVVYQRNQQKTLSRSEGGTGPLEVVIALDPFSQRWNKYLVEIEIAP